MTKPRGLLGQVEQEAARLKNELQGALAKGFEDSSAVQNRYRLLFEATRDGALVVTTKR